MALVMRVTFSYAVEIFMLRLPSPVLRVAYFPIGRIPCSIYRRRFTGTVATENKYFEIRHESLPHQPETKFFIKPVKAQD